MVKQNNNDGFVGVRFNTDWLREFKYKYPKSNISKAIRELMMIHYPMKCDSPIEARLRALAKKLNELRELDKKTQNDIEEILYEIEMWENKKNQPKREL